MSLITRVQVPSEIRINGTMRINSTLNVRIIAEDWDEADSLFDLASGLRIELLDLDVDMVGHRSTAFTPENAKGLGPSAGELIVSASVESIRAVLLKIADWTSRNKRSIEVTIGSDSLKLSQATRDQQQRIIDAWFAQH